MSVRNAAWRSFWDGSIPSQLPDTRFNGIWGRADFPLPGVDWAAGGGQGPGHHPNAPSYRLVLIKSNDSNCISSQLAAH